MIFKVGDMIEWDAAQYFIEQKKYIPKTFLFFDILYTYAKSKKTFAAKIEMVDCDERYYGVYAPYGQDKIPFDKCWLMGTQ